MLAKWITCDVPTASRERFSTAQAKWTVVGDQPGLVGQVWPDARTHRRYTAEVPGLRARAGADADITSTTGHVLALEQAWRVRAIR